MKKINASFIRLVTIILVFSAVQFPLTGQVVNVGKGSYTTTFPGVDAAGRNTYPSGSPYVIGNAANKPVPTNDWWSAKLKNNHVSNLFSYPNTLKTKTSGLVMTYIPWGVIDDQEPLIIGLTSLNASRANVSDYSDWTVTLNWTSGTQSLTATAGIAMPFVYFTKNENDVVQITVNEGSVTVNNEMLIIENVHHGADFAVYAPTGSLWVKNGKIYTSTLNNKKYWSVAHLPSSATSVSSAANALKKFAYVFPTNTTTTWKFDERSSILRTDFVVSTEIKEGSDTTILQGLLPHQWNNLAPGSATPGSHKYKSIRGEIKALESNRFTVENTYYGILPTLPYLNNYSSDFNPSELNKKIQSIENDGLSSWTDSYNEGQVMNRLIQTARIADLSGNTAARDKMLATVKERLEDWLTYKTGEVAFLFYYNKTWSALIGYPAGHGQDGNLNDHHFHWGYFIHAAAFLEQYEPGWAADWGEMVNLLVRDAASPSRNDDKFPFLRSFSPFAGHCWANGFATFPQGNDQESTSESMQFNSSLIHWGTVTGNDEIRDLGIYLYTTEQTAIEEYWFDMYQRNFAASQQYSLVSRVWGNSYDNGTFWTSDIAASYGIEMYPIHGGSFYLGQNQEYVKKLWNEITVNTGILSNQANDNLWHDVMWKYLAFTDPAKAIELYNSYPNRNLKFGISDAQTYYWLHAMNVLGIIDTGVTADYPVAAVFKKEGKRTYVAHNYSHSPIIVNFSDGFKLEVPANTLASSKDIAAKGTLSTLFSHAFVNGNAELEVKFTDGLPTKVEFYNGGNLLGEVSQAPFKFNATNLQAGVHGFYARVYEGGDFSITNIVTFTVGRQLPYSGTLLSIPGTVEPGFYDKFEGGLGQGITYSDVSQNNEGGFRPTEYVDAAEVSGEGATVGWISSGEWLSYSVKVEESGLYNLSFRYASANNSGGGPFTLELDGALISQEITVNSTNGWDKWATKTVNDIPFTKGDHVLRILFKRGEFNLGKLTFSFSAPLPYNQPVANAGENITVVLPNSTAVLNGTSSSNPGQESLIYSWEQVYGPSLIVFSDINSSTPGLSSLVEGVYQVKLTVSNGNYSDSDEVFVIVGPNENIPPTVSIVSPLNNSEFVAGKTIKIRAEALDLDGSILKVDFYSDGNLFGTSLSAPYQVDWTSGIGAYNLTAVATDNKGNSTTSHVIKVIMTQPPSCEGVAFNGDFRYVFSNEANNPTITFIPSQTGVGSPTCILYYGTGAGPFPGYNVKPGVPFRLSAKEGTTINFYFTYSFPGQGEKNTAGKMNSHLIGNCSVSTGIFDAVQNSLLVFPNPVLHEIQIISKLEIKNIEIRNSTGQLVKQENTGGFNQTIGMSDNAAGNYFLSVTFKDGSRTVKKIIKM